MEESWSSLVLYCICMDLRKPCYTGTYASLCQANTKHRRRISTLGYSNLKERVCVIQDLVRNADLVKRANSIHPLELLGPEKLGKRFEARFPN